MPKKKIQHHGNDEERRSVSFNLALIKKDDPELLDN